MSEKDGEIEKEEPVSSETTRKADKSSHSTKFIHNDYTVGWICALPKEQTAAMAMLDQRDPDLPKPPNDHNAYTLGSVRNHKVVIACLPKGKYGNNSAATVAARMVGTFPSIKFGLMVGIGGGIPPNVRLGDVVISSPDYQYPGVVQWDLGKTEEGGKFIRTGALNNPPSALLTALTKLESAHDMNGSKVPRYLDDLKKNWPNLVPKYILSDSLKDPLSVPNNCHRSQRSWQAIFLILWEKILALLSYLLGWSVFTPMSHEAEQVTNNAGSRAIGGEQNRARNMRVHYGLIASGNQVIKDAKVRDGLNQCLGGNLLCVEMEAAGLMNDFPCIVIRGICDYADSQKNKDWQEHAAATAAACAKELLEYVQPSDVDRERPVKDILGLVLDGIKETRNGVDRLILNNHQREIIKWLDPPDPSTNYDTASQRRQEGSGSWFLREEVFAKWKTLRNSVLWLNGIPGCGKTILSSTIIRELKGTLSCQPLLYFYFDFNDIGKQTLESMIRSLICQLYCEYEDIQKQLDLLFSSCKNGHERPTRESLCKVILQMIGQVKEVWIVLDALDECTSRKGGPTEGLLSWIRDLPDPEQRNVHLLVTSRPDQDIESTIREFAYNNIVPIQNSHISGDIRAYVRTRIREDNGLKRWRSNLAVQNEIETRLMEKADGMFRWAACQLDALENCLEYRSLQNALVCLPKTLGETYAKILHGIPDEHKQNATRILQFLTYSKRPLTIEEAVDAIVVDTEETQYFNLKYRMPDPREISRYCSSLVVLVSPDSHSNDKDDKHMELKLAHFSVKEYLMSGKLDEKIAQAYQEAAAKASIATVCLAYLLHLDQDIPLNKIREKFPFAQYSAMYWMDNAAMAKGEDRKLQHFIKELFCHHRSAYRNCYSLYRPDWPWHDEPVKARENPAPALYYASFGGLVNAARYILSQGADVNAQSEYYGSSLQAASAGGHEKVVELLLKNGADTNAQGGYYGSALQAASAKGHEKIVELLLKNGANVNVQSGYYSSSLQAASAEGHEKIVKLLLKNGADINAQNEYYGSALQGASAGGHEKIVKLLLQNGADINAQSEYHGSALQGASAGGHEKIVELLLKDGADVNAQSGHHGSALQAASTKGHKKVVKLLLKNSADVNLQSRHHGNALQAASAEAHEKIVELLLKNGADVNARSEYYGNALQVASAESHEKIVELLLQNGADINAQSKYYGSALQGASAKGREKIVKLLLQNGADVNAKGGHHGSALQAASARNHEEIVELLLEDGANINAQSGHYGSALQAASVEGHKKIVELLLQNGADVNAQGGHHGSALQAASARNHEEIVKLLLKNGADINAQNGHYGGALQAASAKSYEKIVKLLLKDSADINCHDPNTGACDSCL
ncbi:ankyrin repeat-containing domain protein [Bisporella sp. PMI_857]|nr:ankyrin repeat-containing domain protein [Bisporella sp. PMI_857]